VLIEPRPATDGELAALVGEHERELYLRYDGADDGSYLVEPTAHFMVAVIGREAVGCGAIQPDGAGTVELKLVYVRPQHRGRGVARRLVSALEAMAVSNGYDRIRLETGIREPEAIGLCESSGYAPIAVNRKLHGNPFSRCFEKTMLVSAR
jgi:putative acetyltransferase